jgi:CubicO group peptidase (beta-lactamase class C family)
MMRYWRWSARSVIVAPLLAVSVTCAAQPPGGPATSEPATAVASSAVPRAAVGTAIDDYIAHGSVNLQNIRAVVVSQRGELLAERYYHSDAAAYAEIHSATKSVISTLVGIALTTGDLKSLDQTLGELLPQHRSVMSKSSARTTIRQLLTMTGGWTAFYDADTAKPQLVRRLLMAGPEGDPGTFVYSNVGPHLLSAVLAQATGLSTLAYARRELFDPLGINSQPAFEGPMAQRDNPEVVSTNSFRWLRDPDGLHAGPYGLALTARDMVKIGELWLNGGVWHGRRILDANYITQASTNQVPELEGKIRDYGYLWWITPLVTHGAYSAQGRYGQLITVVPDLRAVIVISSRALETAPSIEDHLAMMDAAIVPGLS